MTPEASLLLEAARSHLDEANAIAGIELWSQVGRGAYSAALQAARAYTLELTETASKSHAGTRAKFAELTMNDDRFPPDIRGFLGRSYPLKSAVDYEVGPRRHVSQADASAALETATRSVAHIATILAIP